MYFRYLIFICFILTFVSCGVDQNTKEQRTLIIGKWELAEGRRGGKVTQSLEGTFFEFTPTGKMLTNLPIRGADNSSYEIKDNRILQKLPDNLELVYNIVELTPTNLQLTTTLRGFDFLFLLHKVETSSLSLLLDSELPTYELKR